MAEPSVQNTRRPDSKTVYERLFESIPYAILVVDSGGRIIRANPQVERFFGYTTSELLGNLVEILIPERFRQVHPAHRAHFNEQPRMRPMGEGLELYGLRKDGTEFPVDIMLSPVDTPEGRVALTVIRDITESRQIAEAWRESEQRFRLLVEGIRDYAIFMLDPEGRVSTWNAGAERIKGYSSGEIIGRHFSRFYTEEDVKSGKPDRELETAAAQGRFEDESWRVRKDGSRFWANVVITPVQDDAGKLLGFSKITRDFTERKKAEESVRASEERFRSLFEFSPDAIIVTDQQGKIAETNGQVEKFFGYSRGELVGQAVEILVPERLRHAHPGHRKEYSAQARTRPMGIGLELYGRRKDGTEFPVDIMLSPVEAEGSQLVLSVIRDLSEKKRAEEELVRDGERAD